MYVVVQHQIADPAGFFKTGSKMLSQVPTGLKPHLFLPDGAGKAAVCLWEAKSVDAVQRFVDDSLGATSRNTCFGVDTKNALGLPVEAIVAT